MILLNFNSPSHLHSLLLLISLSSAIVSKLHENEHACSVPLIMLITFNSQWIRNRAHNAIYDHFLHWLQHLIDFFFGVRWENITSICAETPLSTISDKYAFGFFHQKHSNTGYARGNASCNGDEVESWQWGNLLLRRSIAFCVFLLRLLIRPESVLKAARTANSSRCVTYQENCRRSYEMNILTANCTLAILFALLVHKEKYLRMR